MSTLTLVAVLAALLVAGCGGFPPEPGTRWVVFSGHDSCVTYLMAISKVDQRFARVAYDHKPYGNCHVGDGEYLFKRTASDWVHLGDASEPFPCTRLPAGVVRSLLGECSLPAR